MGTKIAADRIYHSDKVLAGVPQLLDDFHKLIDDQESGEGFMLALSKMGINKSLIFSVNKSSNYHGWNLCGIKS